MPAQGEYHHRRPVPDSLTFSQVQVNSMLGHSLAQLYQDVIKAPMPAELQALIHRLEGRPSSSVPDAAG